MFRGYINLNTAMLSWYLPSSPKKNCTGHLQYSVFNFLYKWLYPPLQPLKTSLKFFDTTEVETEGKVMSPPSVTESNRKWASYLTCIAFCALLVLEPVWHLKNVRFLIWLRIIIVRLNKTASFWETWWNDRNNLIYF